MNNFEIGKSYRLKESCINDFLEWSSMNRQIYSVIGKKTFKIINIDESEVMIIEVEGVLYRSIDIDPDLASIFTKREFRYFQPSLNFKFDETKTYAMFSKDGSLIQSPTTPKHIIELFQEMNLSESEVLIFEHVTSAKN